MQNKKSNIHIDSNKLSDKLSFLLSRVERPGRYIGNEINIRIKEWEKADCRICLVYPDTYEIGMAFTGYQILYHILNETKYRIAERAFSPWPDMEELMRKENIPLYSLENKRPLRQFDILGFTLQYEMTFTNILNALDLSKIPLLSADRKEDDPLVFAGGSCAFNPEPLADFVDVFVIGDGEEILPHLCDIVSRGKAERAPRKKILEELNLPENGVYVPSVYRLERDGKVRAAKIPYLKKEYYSKSPIIPIIETTQDRFALEIQRGCGSGCRFCHAGIIYRPVREREPRELIEQTEETLRNTGYEEISLLSLSTSDYSKLGDLVEGIRPVCEENSVAISFPSMRLNSFNLDILRTAGAKKRSGLTFAPEAGSQRLRNVINKNISEEDIFSSVKLALENKWRTMKFYFMVGLPDERDEDLQGIVDLIRKIHLMAKAYPNTQLNITLSSFIPKAHTPFQWAEHLPAEELSRRIHYIRDRLHLPGIKIMHRDPQFSLYESIISRGGREMGRVILSAWQKGAKFDAWSEMFRGESWNAAFRECGVSPEKMIAERSLNDELPWSFIDAGVSDDFLREEWNKALRGETTKDCREYCSLCGVCNTGLIQHISENEISPKTSQEIISKQDSPQQIHTLRLIYEKKDMMRYITHHDLMRVFHRACNILRWPVRYSFGFNARPRIAMGYPVPMGYDAGKEAMDIILDDAVKEPLEALNAVLPSGLCVLSAESIKGRRPSVMENTREMLYIFHFQMPQDVIILRQRLEEALALDNCYMERKHKKGVKKVDIKPFIKYWQAEEYCLSVCYKVIEGKTGRPDEFLKLAFKDNIPAYTGERKFTTLKD